jgi:hypothetical protein
VTKRKLVQQSSLTHEIKRRFVSRLKHCVRNTIILLTVVICHIFSLEAADGESEICPRPTATEAVRDPRCPVRGCIDQHSRRLS